MTSDGPLSLDISFMVTPEDVGHESHEDHLDFGVVKREKWWNPYLVERVGRNQEAGHYFYFTSVL